MRRVSPSRSDTGSESLRSSSQRRGVTRRAVLIGLALIPVNVYWVMVAELRWYMMLTLNPLFVTPVFFLLLLTGINALIKLVRPGRALSVPELLTVYIMLAISCTVATLDYIVNWIRMIGWGAWFATPENKWEEVVFPHMPQWSVMWDESVLTGFFDGGVNPYTLEIMAAWLKPLSAWIVFMLLSFGVMICLSVMVRRAWIEETKLSFPIVRLPLAISGLDRTRFFGSKVMWIGAGLPIINGTLGGLAQLYPSIPYLQTSAHFPSFTNPPWNRLGWMPISFYPFAIGLAYFVPLDVLFSCWFFYLFIKAQSVIGHYLGVVRLPGYPFMAEQAIGAWTAYGVLILYMTRAHWRRLLPAIWHGRPLDDEGELMPYRTAFIGGLICLALLMGFWRAVGMSLLPMLVAVGLYFLLALCLARVRAEAGTPHDVVSLEPMKVFGLVDSRLLGRGDIIGAGLSHWFWRFNRSHALPTQLESLRLWSGTGSSAREMAGPMIAATALACVAAPWASLHIVYREGALAKCMGVKPMTGHEMYTWMSYMLTGDHPVEWVRLVAVGAASGLVVMLWGLQARYAWLWLHPLGYCAGPSLNWVWFPFLIAWLLKAAIVRYGGQRTYRAMMPFFLGLVLGDYVVGAVWAIISPVMGFQGHHIFH